MFVPTALPSPLFDQASPHISLAAYCMQSSFARPSQKLHRRAEVPLKLNASSAENDRCGKVSQLNYAQRLYDMLRLHSFRIAQTLSKPLAWMTLLGISFARARMLMHALAAVQSCGNATERKKTRAESRATSRLFDANSYSANSRWPIPCCRT